MEEIIEEGIIKEAVDFITIKQTEEILNQMKKSICKINGTKTGTGFFCYINYEEKDIPCLLTNYHILDEKFIKKNKKIEISMNDNDINEDLFIEEKDIIYSSPNNKYDTIIIKLKKEENYINFLKLDDKLFNKNSEKGYESIYILHYPNASKASVSYGKGFTLKNTENNYDIEHKCNTLFGSSGGPILNLTNNKVIGIHKGCVKIKDKDIFNIGTLLKFPLNELKNKTFQNSQDFNNNNNKNSQKINNTLPNNSDLIMKNQAKKSICKIESKEKCATGFLLMIPLSDNRKIPVLAFHGCIFYYEELMKGLILKISFDNDDTSMKMKFTEDRVINYDKVHSIAFIEIKNYDKDDKGNNIIQSYNFLELDENAMNPKYFKNYIKDAYMIKYCVDIQGDGKLKLDLSIGKILDVFNEYGEFTHQINSGPGSSGAPILNLKTFKVFGMHHSKIHNKKESVGKILCFAINEFKKVYNLKNKK